MTKQSLVYLKSFGSVSGSWALRISALRLTLVPLANLKTKFCGMISVGASFMAVTEIGRTNLWRAWKENKNKHEFS